MPSRFGVAAAALALLVLGVGGTTGATWSDGQTIPGTDLHTGRLDVTVNGQDAPTGFAALNTSTLVPGGSVAGVLTVRNAGNVPLDLSVAVTGGNADGKGLAAALTRTTTDAATTDGVTCAGTAIGSTTTLAAGASTPVCVQLALPAGAATSLAAATTALTVTVHGTVANAWTDDAPATGSTVATAALAAPAISCNGTRAVTWGAVPGATAYRVFLAGIQVQEVPAGTTTATLGATGVVTVRAVYGSGSWVSVDSNAVNLLGC